MEPRDTSLELSDIQSIVLFAHARMPHAAYLHVTFDVTNAASANGTTTATSANPSPNAWLREMNAEVHVVGGGRDGRAVGDRLHVAFTHAGLRRFGLDENELASFPREYRHGMGHELRSRVLGDVGPNAPAKWEFGGPQHRPIHVLLMLYSRTRAGLERLVARCQARIAAHGGDVLHRDTCELREPQTEPFGFRDGIGQPHVAGSPRPRRDHEDEVAAGEFLLGYANAYGELPESPRMTSGFDFGRNGSYLVYRKLHQDVAGFWRCMFEQAKPAGGHHDNEARANAEAIRLASRIVGRWPSGAPLVAYPDEDPGEFTATADFAFVNEDPDGSKCPFGAHIRRANPRDMLEPSPDESRTSVGRHRILRRGRSYGPSTEGTPRARMTKADSDGAARGLVFLALNTSLRRQFEFIQQTWLNNSKFAGLSEERDPLVSTMDDAERRFTMPGDPARQRLSNLPSFVTMRGGGYFFLPGRGALDWLAKRTPAERAPAEHAMREGAPAERTPAERAMRER